MRSAQPDPLPRPDSWIASDGIVKIVIFLAALMLLGRLSYQLVAPPLPDEAYYWLWGQHLDWSYYDHPPLQAWMQGAIAAMGIGGLFGLRVLPTLITTGVLLWALALMLRSRGLAGAQLVAVLAVFLASPVFLVFTTLVFHDHLMLAWLAPGLVAAAAVLGALDRGEPPRPWHIYAVGLCLGLAMLTKYNAALVALGLIVLIVWHRPYRALLRNPHLYGAMLIASLCLFPVFWWNLNQDAASFQYNLHDRLDFVASRVAGNALGYVLGGVAAFSLFLIPALWRVLRAGPVDATGRVAVAAFAVPSLVWLAATSVTHVLFYWNIPAYLFILPLAVLALRRSWAVLAHMTLGVVVAFGLTVNYAHVPVVLMVGDAVDHETGLGYGWDIIAPRMQALGLEQEAPRLVAADYRYGSILAWTTRDTSVEVYSLRKSQFDIWQARAPAPTEDAIILTSERFPMRPQISDRFARVTHLERHDITWRGRSVVTWDIWLGEVNAE
jgi:4-amino-4-deoxy-L-arabinose transferase-like glycosyltransferase